MQLRYLFTAEFADGTKIVQNQEDVSLLEEGKNIYYDVLKRQEKVPLALFTIREQKIWNPAEIKVDLETGVLIVNGVRLYHEELPQGTKYELYWMMQVIQTMRIDRRKGIGGSIRQTPLPENRTYFVGWKASAGGEEYQQIVGVK